MATFANLTLGTRAVKVVQLPLPGGAEVPVGVRPLLGRELGEVLSRARAYAVAHGLPTPTDGDRLFELGQMAHTLAIGCVDADCVAPGAPADAPHRPFFASAEEILDNLDPDRIVLLYEQQQAWQDECSPRVSEMGPGDFFAKVLECAGWKDGQPDPLLRLRPSMRPSFTATLAVQFLNCLSGKSPSGSDSEKPTSAT